jgi:hypothetical protein
VFSEEDGMAVWMNEPASWDDADGVLTVVTVPGTDFWRKTHYGFVRDNGHFYATEVDDNFDVEVVVAGLYRTLYDQAGVIVRADASAWMKCGIEFVDGHQHASVVVTRDFSDWSVTPLPDLPEAVRLKVARRGQTLEISWSRIGGEWTMLRLAHLPMGDRVLVGPMAASPEDRGFSVRFSEWRISKPRMG